ncbi:hypothetical protein [Spongiimicrobium salis]|uniref:hypothetical protein n=1 Tax=Spongiimicrobium salis TaxID=1667022 RepID=UPI00374CA62E
MTLEIIVFTFAILFGIVWYWRESKSNKIYRTINKITHTKELQMKPENKKGFIHEQDFLMRLVWVSLFFIVAASLITFATPINAFSQYLASAIVGTLIGTYIASFFLFAHKTASKENLEKVVQKGKDFVEDIMDGDEEVVEEKKAEDPPKTDAPPKKSARDRFKDKGMIK